MPNGAVIERRERVLAGSAFTPILRATRRSQDLIGKATTAMTRTIVCFGDSNTWGYDPATSSRFAPDVRWTGVLQRTLGDGYRVVEEGLNGRTTNLDDPMHPFLNGLTYLQPCLESQMPLDLVTIMLGTNDLKLRFGRSGSDIAEAAASLAGIAKHLPVGPDGGNPKVLLIVPPPVATLTDYAEMFTGAEEKSRRFAQHYRTIAQWHAAPVFDAGEVIRSSDLDGIHFEAAEHRKLGEAVAREVVRLLG
jgi:lysophospholipase L1-like esterase